ncbi:hypothetical protein DO71_6015 [Burkholderia pseudomallei]|nr:hypothetical protein DO71_6015 [Burkholderia pseudomallei]
MPNEIANLLADGRRHACRRSNDAHPCGGRCFIGRCDWSVGRASIRSCRLHVATDEMFRKRSSGTVVHFFA